MGVIRNIVEAMERCAKQGCDSCEGCPYYGNHRDGLSCRQTLLIDAAEMLNILSMKEQTSVCFERKTIEMPCVEAGEGSAAAYWHGYADALKWAFSDRFEDMAGAEGKDNV